MPAHSTITLAAAIALLAACSSSPTDPSARDLAPSFSVTEPGIPGDPNCRGQSTAFLAQAGKNAGVEGVRGIGGLARFAGLTVQEIKAIVDEFCAGV
jgi:hypothetical protein